MEPQYPPIQNPDMQPTRGGISLSRVTATIFIALLLVAGGYFLRFYTYKPAPAPAKTTPPPQTSSVDTFEKCAEAGGSIYTKQVVSTSGTEITGTCAMDGKSFLPLDDTDLRSWTVVASTQVSLTQFGVQLTLPSSAVGTLMYHYDPEGTYSIIPKGMLTNKQCAAYLDKATGSSDAFDGMILNKLDPNTQAATELGAAAGTATTISEYYQLHKASAGNFFSAPVSDALGGTKEYWNVGTSFYSLETRPNLYQGLDFAKDCPGLTGDYEQQIVSAMPSMIPLATKTTAAKQ